MRHYDTGKGYPKAIVALLVLAAVAYVGTKVVPIYIANYEMQDFIRQLSVQMSARGGATVEMVQNAVLSKAQDLGLPMTRENVKVRIAGSVSVALDYQVPVDLKVYTWVLHFTPSSENVL